MISYILVVKIFKRPYFSFQKFMIPQYVWDPPIPKKMIAPLVWKEMRYAAAIVY